MTRGLLGGVTNTAAVLLMAGCGQSSTPAPSALDLTSLGVASGDRVTDIARHNGDLYIVARPTNAPRYLIAQGTVQATAPGLRRADGLAVAANGVYAWTPVDGGPIVIEDLGGRIEIPGTNGLGIDEIEIAEPHVLILARDGSNKRLMVYDKAQSAVVANELLGAGSWLIQHGGDTPTWTIPRVNGGTSSDAPVKFRDSESPPDILRRGPWGSGGSRLIGFGYRDQEILAPLGSQVETVRFIDRDFALPRPFEVSGRWVINGGVLLYLTHNDKELVAQPLAVPPHAIETATVYKLPDAMVSAGADLHSDMDDGVVFVSGGGLLLEYDLATKSLRTPR